MRAKVTQVVLDAVKDLLTKKRAKMIEFENDLKLSGQRLLEAQINYAEEQRRVNNLQAQIEELCEFISSADVTPEGASDQSSAQCST